MPFPSLSRVGEELNLNIRRKRKNKLMTLKLMIILFSIIINMASFGQQSNPRPNIIWIVCEDISPTLSMYGDPTAKTPHLDALASQSTVYHNAFAVVGVCAPSRSAIITGNYPTTIGTMHMRTASDITAEGKRTYNTTSSIKDISGQSIREYSAVVPDGVKCFTEYLRAAQYFCTNNQKTDYQFAAPITAWDQNHAQAHWRNRPNPDQPFFSVFNFNETHESSLWSNSHLKLTVNPDNVPIPSYLVPDDSTRIELARHYSNIELLDARVGQIIDQLKEDGMYDQSIILFYSDHGGPFPRQKRETNDRGLKIPLLIKLPYQKTRNDNEDLISLIDLAPSMLSLANIKPPKSMEGKAFLGKYKSRPNKYIVGTGDRFDEYTDRVRSIRTKEYLYIYNYYPDKPAYMDINYRKKLASMRSLLVFKQGRSADDIVVNNERHILSWFYSPRPTEILIDVRVDSENLYNIANHEDQKKALKKMRKLYRQHWQKHPDLGVMPESKLIASMYPQNQQLITQKPIIKTLQNGKISIVGPTPSSSIAYIITDTPQISLDRKAPWQLYTIPIDVPPGKHLHAVAERIGYMTSEVMSI